MIAATIHANKRALIHESNYRVSAC
jgi:hypothetical protein